MQLIDLLVEDNNENGVRPGVLFLPVHDDHLLEMQLEKLVVFRETSRSWRQVPLSLELNKDVMLRNGFKFTPVPGGERADGRMSDPVRKGAILAIHVADISALSKSSLLRRIRNVPIVGHDADSRLLLKHWHLLQSKPPEAEIVEPQSDDRRLLRQFYAMPEREQLQLLSRIHSLVSWIEGWQMEGPEVYHSYNRLFALMQKAIVPRYAAKLQEIYRSAYLDHDLSGMIGQRRLLTSPYEFQSWTTTPRLAYSIGIRNLIAASSPTRHFMTIFKANTTDVQVMFAVRDLRLFARSLLRSEGWRHLPFKYREGIESNLHSVAQKLDEAGWQDEVVVHSPVNRKIVANVVSVTANPDFSHDEI